MLTQLVINYPDWVFEQRLSARSILTEESMFRYGLPWSKYKFTPPESVNHIADLHEVKVYFNGLESIEKLPQLSWLFAIDCRPRQCQRLLNHSHVRNRPWDTTLAFEKHHTSRPELIEPSMLINRSAGSYWSLATIVVISGSS